MVIKKIGTHGTKIVIVLNLIRSNLIIDSLADCTYRRKFFKGVCHNTEPFKLPFSRSKSR